MQYQNRKIFKMLTLSASILAILNPGTSKATDVDWITVGDGFWDVSANWSSNPNLPGQNDDVSIDVGGSGLLATISHRSGNNTINSLASQENFALTGGTLTINNTSTISAAYTQTSGTLGGSGDITVTGLTRINNGSLAGTGTFFANGDTQLNGGSLSGSRTLQLNSAATWSDRFDINTGTTLRNTSGNTLAITNNFTSFGSGLIDNQGILSKTAGTGTTNIDARLNNTGTVNIQTGTLSLRGGSTSSGDFNVAAGSTLDFNGGTHNLNNINFGASTGTLSVFRGTVNTTGPLNFGGEVILDIATLNNNDAATLANYTQNNGTLGGPGNVTVSGLTRINNGSLAGTGTFFANGGIQLSGGSLSDSRTLQLNSAATWSDRFDINTGTTLRNTSGNTLAITNDFNTFGSGVLDNQGVLSKIAGTGVTRIDSSVNNTGTTNVQSGELRLSSAFTNQGTVTVSENAVFHVSNSNFANQGRIEGNGTIQTANAASSLVNSGVLSAGINGTGNLSIIGDYTQTETGFFDIQLGSLTDFDKLNVAGDLNLAGTLRIFSLNDYNPLDGDSFTIATFDDGVADLSDITGVFSNIVWAGFLPGVTFTASYFDHSIVLNASAASSAVPVPGAAWLFGTGLAGLIASKRNRVSVKS
ncbi:MAG: hypothetical protein CTY29_00125 [Methylobacter sp.]|nr:MAG: hypothetical protein CTY29_00125 [Methylobacter sp.]